MKRLSLSISLLIGFSLISSSFCFSQKRVDLEKERNAIIKQIELADQQVNLATKNTKESVNEYTALNVEIKSRETLISNLKKQLGRSFEAMKNNQDSILTLSTQLQQLTNQYENIVRLAYIKRKYNNSFISLFSTKGVNNALLLWRYTNQFSEFITRKKDVVDNLKDAINLKTQSIEEEQNYTNTLLEDEKHNFNKLERAQLKKKTVLTKLKKKEKELKLVLKTKESEREKLNTKIENIILTQLKESNRTKNTKVSSNGFSSYHSLMWPVTTGYIESNFGQQSHPTIKNLKISNNGIDIVSDKFANVKAIEEGTVVGITTIPGYNKMIIIEHGQYFTVYSKLESALVKKGQSVLLNDNIGKLGPSGKLHFEIWKNKKKLNPSKWLVKK